MAREDEVDDLSDDIDDLSTEDSDELDLDDDDLDEDVISNDNIDEQQQPKTAVDDEDDIDIPIDDGEEEEEEEEEEDLDYDDDDFDSMDDVIDEDDLKSSQTPRSAKKSDEYVSAKAEEWGFKTTDGANNEEEEDYEDGFDSYDDSEDSEELKSRLAQERLETPSRMGMQRSHASIPADSDDEDYSDEDFDDDDYDSDEGHQKPLPTETKTSAPARPPDSDDEDAPKQEPKESPYDDLDSDASDDAGPPVSFPEGISRDIERPQTQHLGSRSESGKDLSKEEVVNSGPLEEIPPEKKKRPAKPKKSPSPAKSPRSTSQRSGSVETSIPWLKEPPASMILLPHQKLPDGSSPSGPPKPKPKPKPKAKVKPKAPSPAPPPEATPPPIKEKRAPPRRPKKKPVAKKPDPPPEEPRPKTSDGVSSTRTPVPPTTARPKSSGGVKGSTTPRARAGRQVGPRHALNNVRPAKAKPAKVNNLVSKRGRNYNDDKLATDLPNISESDEETERRESRPVTHDVMPLDGRVNRSIPPAKPGREAQADKRANKAFEASLQAGNMLDLHLGSIVGRLAIPTPPPKIPGQGKSLSQPTPRSRPPSGGHSITLNPGHAHEYSRALAEIRPKSLHIESGATNWRTAQSPHSMVINHDVSDNFTPRPSPSAMDIVLSSANRPWSSKSATPRGLKKKKSTRKKRLEELESGFSSSTSVLERVIPSYDAISDRHCTFVERPLFKKSVLKTRSGLEPEKCYLLYMRQQKGNTKKRGGAQSAPLASPAVGRFRSPGMETRMRMNSEAEQIDWKDADLDNKELDEFAQEVRGNPAKMSPKELEESFERMKTILESLWTVLKVPKKAQKAFRKHYFNPITDENYANTLGAVSKLSIQRTKTKVLVDAVGEREDLLRVLREEEQFHGGATDETMEKFHELTNYVGKLIHDWRSQGWLIRFYYGGRDYLEKLHEDVAKYSHIISGKLSDSRHSSPGRIRSEGQTPTGTPRPRSAFMELEMAADVVLQDISKSSSSRYAQLDDPRRKRAEADRSAMKNIYSRARYLANNPVKVLLMKGRRHGPFR